MAARSSRFEMAARNNSMYKSGETALGIEQYIQNMIEKGTLLSEAEVRYTLERRQPKRRQKNSANRLKQSGVSPSS
jgi:hypothetical protein